MIKYIKNFNEYQEILIFFLPVALINFGYWKGLKKKFKNVYENECILNNITFKIFDKYYSLWPVSHLLIYILASLRFQKLNQKIFLFFIGIIWEIIEEKLSYIIKLDKEDKTFKKKHAIKIKGKLQYENWWSGTFSDIIFNTLGITIGILIINYKIFPTYITRILNTIFIFGILFGLHYTNFHPLFIVSFLLSLKYTFIY